MCDLCGMRLRPFCTQPNRQRFWVTFRCRLPSRITGTDSRRLRAFFFTPRMYDVRSRRRKCHRPSGSPPWRIWWVVWHTVMTAPAERIPLRWVVGSGLVRGSPRSVAAVTSDRRNRELWSRLYEHYCGRPPSDPCDTPCIGMRLVPLQHETAMLLAPRRANRRKRTARCRQRVHPSKSASAQASIRYQKVTLNPPKVRLEGQCQLRCFARIFRRCGAKWVPAPEL